MVEKLQNCLEQLVGSKLKDIKLVCQMIVFDFGNVGIHCQQFTRVSKNGDILFTTLDYQSWDEKKILTMMKNIFLINIEMKL
ncbi:MAG: hypothetical protein ACI311_05695 [Bacilli bacterium]